MATFGAESHTYQTQLNKLLLIFPGSICGVSSPPGTMPATGDMAGNSKDRLLSLLIARQINK
jgi:hypothetical protein